MADAVARCQRCGAAPKAPHWNARYCLPCRAAIRRRPRSCATPAERAAILARAGTMTRDAIAAAVGVSRAKVTRCLREEHVRSNARDLAPELVEAVLRLYAAAPTRQGKAACRAAFPDVCIRSITERHTRRHGTQAVVRQARWTGAQVIDAARMAGLVSLTAQARYFSRPHAAEGSIKKLWASHFRCPPGALHGCGAALAARLALPGVQATLITTNQGGVTGPTIKVLWLDLLARLRPDCDPTLRLCVTALAQFQAWLWQTTDSQVIRNTLTEREDYAATPPGLQWSDDAPPDTPIRPRTGGDADPEYPRGGADAALPDDRSDETGHHPRNGQGGVPVRRATRRTHARVH